MDIKCSAKKHSEYNAICYCYNCKKYLCSKCQNYHSELFEDHQLFNVDKNTNLENIFTGYCKEKNHSNQYEYFCKNHNKLCCVECICKIKDEIKGQHHDCDVCKIENIVEEKRNKLKENIKCLEELNKSLENSINELKKIIEKKNEEKEKLKLEVQNIFTKIRNALNEKEDDLLIQIDKEYDNLFINDNLVKESEKYPDKVNNSLEKGKNIDNEWNNNKLSLMINDCINIENNIKNIFEIKEKIKYCNSKIIEINFNPEKELPPEIIEYIKKFGEILNSERNNLNFRFIPGNNYTINKNGLLAIKNNGGNSFNCLILGDKEIPKNKVSQWSIKINKNKNPEIGIDILIGIGPSKFKGRMQDEVWCILANNLNNVGLRMKGKSLDYRYNKVQIKQDDIVTVIVDRIKGNLSFYLNDINLGIVCSNIPFNEELYPAIILYEQGQNVEVVV